MERQIRVLLVEDSEDDAILVTEELRAGGFEPLWHQVDSRESMLTALEESGWELIISDHSLPKFSALEALRLLLDSGRDIPFIIVSGTIGEEVAIEAMKAGAYDYVMKDRLGRLAPAVEHALRAAEIRRSHRAAQQEILESRERLRELTAHLTTAREQERARLAREIHDELGGALTALKLDIRALGNRMEGRDGEAGEKLASMAAATDMALENLRRIISELRPAILDDLGLVAAIEWQLKEFRRRFRKKCRLEVSPELEWESCGLDANTAVGVFRIFQESLNNIVRHAEAESVSVSVLAEPQGGLTMEVRDDGRGFAPSQLEKQGSYGVLGMRERALQLGGTLAVSGHPGQGSCVCLRLPGGLLRAGEERLRVDA